MDFSGKKVLVTGGTRGIGRATVEAFLKAGATVAVNGSSEASVGKALAGLGAGNQAVGAPGDLGRVAECRRVVEGAVAALGGLDVLVNNAGIEILGTVAETTPEIWDEVMAVNLRGTYLMSRAALPALLDSAGRAGEAAIVNNASLMGLVSSARLAAYCASKAGVVSLTRSMALDHADRHLRVNCVCPGIVHTPMLERRFALEPDRAAAYRRTTERPPIKYLGRPEDVAAMIAYLASTEARFVTGAAFTIDGGVGAS